MNKGQNNEQSDHVINIMYVAAKTTVSACIAAFTRGLLLQFCILCSEFLRFLDLSIGFIYCFGL